MAVTCKLANPPLFAVLLLIWSGCSMDVHEHRYAEVKNNHPLRVSRVVELFAQLVWATDYCHTRRVCHRDIKL